MGKGQRSEVSGQKSEVRREERSEADPRLNTLEGNPIQLGREVKGRERTEVGSHPSEMRFAVTGVNFTWQRGWI